MVGEHFSERGGPDRPRSGLGHLILERRAHPQLGARARPALTTGAALIAEATEVYALVAEQIAVTRDVKSRRAPAVVVLAIEARLLQRARRAGAEVVIHEIVSQLSGAAPQAAGPHIGRGSQQQPRRIQCRRAQEDDARRVIGGLHAAPLET